MELTAAYSALANDGTYLEPVAFTRVEDAQGNVILDSGELRSARQVFKPATSYMITSILEDAVKSGTGWRAKIKA